MRTVAALPTILTSNKGFMSELIQPRDPVMASTASAIFPVLFSGCLSLATISSSLAARLLFPKVPRVRLLSNMRNVFLCDNSFPPVASYRYFFRFKSLLLTKGYRIINVRLNSVRNKKAPPGGSMGGARYKLFHMEVSERGFKILVINLPCIDSIFILLLTQYTFIEYYIFYNI